ncbi:MAG: hypothetical protein R3281_18410, partial [Balneolaceae bacterium]|nr:hypothetical protein [Balneolaceae bacterium]
ANLYDFFGILILLASTVFVMSLLNNRRSLGRLELENDEGESRHRSTGNKLLIWQLRLIEKIKLILTSENREDNPIQAPRLMSMPNTDNRWKYSVLLVAAVGSAVRLYPVLLSPVPPNSNWFFALQKVKNIRLQQLFADIPEPPGFYAVISFFEHISQVKPELIIHFAEALVVVPVSITIYWMIRKAVVAEYEETLAHYAALGGMLAYAIAPMLVMESSLVHIIQQNKINLALSLAVPGIYGFSRYFEAALYRKLFYFGFIGTAIVDIFIFLNLLLPFIIVIGCYSLYQDKGRKRIYRLLVALAAAIVVFGCYSGLVLFYGLDYEEFLLWQLFNPQVYDAFSEYLARHRQLYTGYLVGGGLTALGYLAAVVRNGTWFAREWGLVVLFLLLGPIYLPETEFHPAWIDDRQLYYLFPVFCAMLFGLVLLNILRFLVYILDPGELVRKRMALALVLVAAVGFGFSQLHMTQETQYQRTVPDGFFDAYYRIAEDRVPYSYTIVAPTVMQTMSQNRNNFLDYTFFLNNFARYDSLFYQKLKQAKKADIPLDEVQFQYRPSPSVFVFVANPPYDFQSSNIINLESTMQRLNRWLTEYEEKEDRVLHKFHETADTIIYELVYETGPSAIDQTLHEVYTDKPWPLLEE